MKTDKQLNRVWNFRDFLLQKIVKFFAIIPSSLVNIFPTSRASSTSSAANVHNTNESNWFFVFLIIINVSFTNMSFALSDTPKLCSIKKSSDEITVFDIASNTERLNILLWRALSSAVGRWCKAQATNIKCTWSKPLKSREKSGKQSWPALL